MPETSLAQPLMDRLKGRRFRFDTEKELQQELAESFAEWGYVFERERQLGDEGRVDFFFHGGLAVEVKTKGSLSGVKRQLFGYACHPHVEEVLLVTSLARLADQPGTMAGIPVRVVILPGGLA